MISQGDLIEMHRNFLDMYKERPELFEAPTERQPGAHPALGASYGSVPINIAITINFDDHKGCNHRWKNYVGFSEAYKYCTKCSEKRNLDEQ